MTHALSESDKPVLISSPIKLSWLEITRGESPLIVSVPHTGTDIPTEYSSKFASPWLARLDTDWWVDCLYDFAASELNATVIRTSNSRSVIDVNRDPIGISLYPGRPSTELCPTVTFDGVPIYREGRAPEKTEIDHRRKCYFDPYHAAIQEELVRLKETHDSVVLFDCHSIRSVNPRLFPGVLPELNVGTNDGLTCDPDLARGIMSLCAKSGRSFFLNGRFKGGWITRHYGNPGEGVHAVQMELACRSYLREPAVPFSEANWPRMYDQDMARPTRELLREFLRGSIEFARSAESSKSNARKKAPERS